MLWITIDLWASGGYCIISVQWYSIHSPSQNCFHKEYMTSWPHTIKNIKGGSHSPNLWRSYLHLPILASPGRRIHVVSVIPQYDQSNTWSKDGIYLPPVTHTFGISSRGGGCSWNPCVPSSPVIPGWSAPYLGREHLRCGLGQVANDNKLTWEENIIAMCHSPTVPFVSFDIHSDLGTHIRAFWCISIACCCK